MTFNPFASVSDYPGMLNKIATFTFAVSVSGVWLLRHEFPGLDTALAKLTLGVPLASGLSIPLGTILPAFLVALGSRIFKLHDRLSDVFLIRKRFDVSEILHPLAIVAASSLTAGKVREIARRREELMKKTFYKYASSSPGKAVIETHCITMALDQWCWYWIVLEATFLAFALGVIFLLSAKYALAAVFFLSVIGAFGGLQLIRVQCARYALQEVEQIVDDAQRREQIAKEFNAL